MSEVRTYRLGSVRQQTLARLRAISDTPALDAEVLLRAATGLTRSALLARPEFEISSAQHSRLVSLCERRLRGEPIAYITGAREFWSLEFTVSPEVLIPRPETEHLVEHALALIPRQAEWTIADLGTGSGAIAIALARERPRCRVIGTDISEPALALARQNAARLCASLSLDSLPQRGKRGTASLREHLPIEWRLGNWLEALAGLPPLDLIVSNPPYVRSYDPHLARSDVRFEPRRALDGGADGLNAIRTLVARAYECLRDGGTLLLEHGADQPDAVRELFARHGWRHIRQYPDYANLPRISGALR